MQNEQQQQVIKALKEANNVLVTVKNSPSVDELSAAVGLTLALNKADKHATTVFSGNVPSTIEFLQPETVIESNTDSLRDFIIALDKSKADKLRYKVEDSVVRIFITPYRASISEHDLEFSQGDFNVDVVIALGVVTKDDFDTAVTAHGRILHDATVIGITKQEAVSQVGSLNWQEPQASSVSEMISKVVDGIDPQLVDGQMATAFLTGIVAETDRFKNDKTTPDVLSIGSRLMTAGANQQLIAEKLEEPVNEKPITKIANHKEGHEDGALEIDHDEDEVTGIEIDEHGNLGTIKDDSLPPQGDQAFEGLGEQPQAEPEEHVVESPQAPEEASRQYISTPIPPNNGAVLPNTVKPAHEVTQPTMPAQPVQPPSPDAVVNAQQESGEPIIGTPDDEPSTPVDALPEPDKQAQTPVMEHKQKTLQPVSDEFKGHVTSNPQEPLSNNLADLEARVTESDGLDAARQQVDSLAQPQLTPQQNIGAQHVDLGQPPAVQQPTEQEVAPVSDARPAPLTSTDSQDVRQDPDGPPAVPPPLMPPNSQPQFFDADGKNNNPFSAQ